MLENAIMDMSSMVSKTNETCTPSLTAAYTTHSLDLPTLMFVFTMLTRRKLLLTLVLVEDWIRGWGVVAERKRGKVSMTKCVSWMDGSRVD